MCLVFNKLVLFQGLDRGQDLVRDGGEGGSSQQKELKLRFDVSQYSPEEIVVKTVDNKLLVSPTLFLVLHGAKYKTCCISRHAELFFENLRVIQGGLNSLLKNQGGLVDMAFSCWHHHCYETSGEVENLGGIQDMAILQKNMLAIAEIEFELVVVVPRGPRRQICGADLGGLWTKTKKRRNWREIRVVPNSSPASSIKHQRVNISHLFRFKRLTLGVRVNPNFFRYFLKLLGKRNIIDKVLEWFDYRLGWNDLTPMCQVIQFGPNIHFDMFKRCYSFIR